MYMRWNWKEKRKKKKEKRKKKKEKSGSISGRLSSVQKRRKLDAGKTLE